MGNSEIRKSEEGYNEEDLMEYLNNSFQPLIWERGYSALVIG